MKQLYAMLLALGMMVAAAMPSVYAYGYGTSSIALANSTVSAAPGAAAAVGYTVNLATGSTWGTTLSVVNNNQLSAQGIMTSISNPAGDPPYSGTLTITVGASVANGAYNVVLTATGDDPSTSNATLQLNVQSAAPLTTIASQTNGTNNGTAASTTVQTTIPAATTVYASLGAGSYGSTTPPSYGWSMNKILLYALVIIVLLVALASLFIWKATPTRLTVIGVALLIIGTAAWLYGDYAGGDLKYIWGGVAAIVVGTLLWIYADKGMLRHRGAAGMLAWAGIALIVLGTLAWLYGDYTGGQLQYVWSGVIAILLGTLIWVLGDWKAGAFMRRGKK